MWECHLPSVPALLLASLALSGAGLPLRGATPALDPQTKPAPDPQDEPAAKTREGAEGNFSRQQALGPSSLDSGQILGGDGIVKIGGVIRKGSGFLRAKNGTLLRFASCDQACDRCFDEHYQGCLAFCNVGCEEYCTKRLPRPHCEHGQEWVARVAHVFQALDAQARMCQATGLNGCPAGPTLPPTAIPFDSYGAADPFGELGARPTGEPSQPELQRSGEELPPARLNGETPVQDGQEPAASLRGQAPSAG